MLHLYVDALYPKECTKRSNNYLSSVNTCMWLPVIRRKACTGNDMACPVHQHWLHEWICLRPHAYVSDRIATLMLLLPTSNCRGVDTCGVASGHTQMTMPTCVRSFSRHYESPLLAIGCRTQRAESVVDNIPHVAPAFRSTTRVGHHVLEGCGVIANR